MIQEIYSQIHDSIASGYGVGVIIGILILLLLLKFIQIVILYIFTVIEDILNNIFKHTKYANKVDKALRIIGNVIERGKFSDPKKDLWGFLYEEK